MVWVPLLSQGTNTVLGHILHRPQSYIRNNGGPWDYTAAVVSYRGRGSWTIKFTINSMKFGRTLYGSRQRPIQLATRQDGIEGFICEFFIKETSQSQTASTSLTIPWKSAMLCCVGRISSSKIANYIQSCAMFNDFWFLVPTKSRRGKFSVGSYLSCLVQCCIPKAKPSKLTSPCNAGGTSTQSSTFSFPSLCLIRPHIRWYCTLRYRTSLAALPECSKNRYHCFLISMIIYK